MSNQTSKKKLTTTGRAPFYGSNSKTISYPPMSPSMSYKGGGGGGGDHEVISQASNHSRIINKATAVQLQNHPNTTTNEGMLWPDLNV